MTTGDEDGCTWRCPGKRAGFLFARPGFRWLCGYRLVMAAMAAAALTIAEVISALLNDKITLDEAAAALMQRPPKPEH
ncbi:hypothetical protein [Streptomyces sp. NPDC059278]|uniref:hypothetical protein n=1 Tax=Streptomyces sp. NPDC059278 TaxID=3346801 RepID=UPI0036CB4AE1